MTETGRDPRKERRMKIRWAPRLPGAAVVTVWLIRHAGTAGAGPGDPGLSPEGRTDGRTAAALADRPISRVYTSPLLRARETAELPRGWRSSRRRSCASARTGGSCPGSP